MSEGSLKVTQGQNKPSSIELLFRSDFVKVGLNNFLWFQIKFSVYFKTFEKVFYKNHKSDNQYLLRFLPLTRPFQKKLWNLTFFEALASSNLTIFDVRIYFPGQNSKFFKILESFLKIVSSWEDFLVRKGLQICNFSLTMQKRDDRGSIIKEIFITLAT